MPRYYLAGPMSGLPQFNFPAFYAATAALRSAGYDIISPAELDDKDDAGVAMASKDGNPTSVNRTWGDFLARDVKIISEQAQGIIYLPNWWTSRGAKLESFVGLLHKDFKFGVYTAGASPLVSWVPASFVLATIATNMQVAA